MVADPEHVLLMGRDTRSDIGQPRGNGVVVPNTAPRTGLCQIYRNEPWHYELRPKPSITVCPAMVCRPCTIQGCHREPQNVPIHRSCAKSRTKNHGFRDGRNIRIRHPPQNRIRNRRERKRKKKKKKPSDINVSESIFSDRLQREVSMSIKSDAREKLGSANSQRDDCRCGRAVSCKRVQ
jgi:hypothetical protein